MTDKIREWRDEAEKLQLIDQFPEELRELARSFPLDKLRLCLEARKKFAELHEFMVKRNSMNYDPRKLNQNNQAIGELTGMPAVLRMLLPEWKGLVLCDLISSPIERIIGLTKESMMYVLRDNHSGKFLKRWPGRNGSPALWVDGKKTQSS